MQGFVKKFFLAVIVGSLGSYKLTVVQAYTRVSSSPALFSCYESKKDAVVLVRCFDKSKREHVASGFFTSEYGHVLTSASVVDNCEKFSIEWHKLRYDARLLGVDITTNVALMQLEEKALPKGAVYLNLNEKNPLPEICNNVFSLSYKLGLNVSPQQGFVTGINGAYFDQEWPTTLVRSNLSIDGGDIGGPVFNEYGDLQGMLLHALAETRETYFLPTRALAKIHSDLLLFGRVRYGYLGLEIEVVLDKNTQKLRIQVIDIIKNSPADNAGFREGDIILSCNNTLINTRDDFRNFAFFSYPEQKVVVKILRQSKELSLAVTISERQ